MTDLGVCRQPFVVSSDHAGVGGRAGLPLINLAGTKESALNGLNGNYSSDGTQFHSIASHLYQTDHVVHQPHDNKGGED